MKSTLRFGLLLAMFSLTALTGQLKAQNATKDLLAFTKQFQTAYNKKDVKAIKEMYTADATRTNPDGSTITGIDNIMAEFDKQFEAPKLMIEIKQENASNETDGSVTATGTYHVSGTAATGEKIERDGKYTNTAIKDKGHWKIAKMVLATM